MANEISAKTVKELREITSAGMMDCKKALQEADGNMEKAIESLRVKGLASAKKKLDRVATEGIIKSYIHAGGKLGVIVEVNCETDFVARRTEFQDLAQNVAMQIAACPSVEFIKFDDIPDEVKEREKSIEMLKDDLANKPDDLKEKIVSGRIQKRLKDLVLLEQPFIRDTNMTIEDLVKQSISLLGENIQIRRFQKFILGEGLEKKQDNFKEEVESML